ncbi:MAG TPA: ABC transporter ATP-binding protein [Bryobacteraceae bacterium]|nr:ABC transporter ATP-binding protein [Bryobacteraceae bacterium]
MSQPLLSVNITVDYPTKKDVLSGVELEVGEGEIVGLVGQSGSGKSTLALSILRLLGSRRAVVTGEIAFRDLQLLELNDSQIRSVRGKEIALALQSAAAALNPALRIETQLREVWKAHRPGKPDRAFLADLLRSVELPDEDTFLRRYPGQISIGQAQRVVIAMAIMHRPALLIVDEPTSALDLVTQSQLLKLFHSLNRDHQVSILYISHDLLSVASLCSRMYVLREGQVVESGSVDTMFANPRHPYSRLLIEAIPMKGRNLDPVL